MTQPPARPAPRLLAISDRHSLPGGNLERWLSQLATGPVDTVQIREKDLDDRDLLELVSKARTRLPQPIAVLVNGRADVAIAAGADGVHLPSDAVPVQALRRRFGSRMTIGVSTHSPAEVAAARAAGADYATFGPVWETPSKTAYGPPPGLDGLRRAAAVGLPVLALGGVTIERASAAKEAGAAGIAAIRLFSHPDTTGIERLADLFPPPSHPR